MVKQPPSKQLSSKQPMSKQPLSGIRVIDASRVLAGPYCALLLQHLGAEVIKIEPPQGDECRGWPPYRRSADGNGSTDSTSSTGSTVSTVFLSLNAGKRSMVLDLKRPEARAVLERLLARSDVFIENFRGAQLRLFDLTAAALRRRHRHLVHVSVSAFGRRGPRAEEGGYEAMLQAFSGAMHLTGEPEGPPVRAGTSFLDMGTGAFAALTAVTGIWQRERQGEGVSVDVALLRTALSMMSNHVSTWLQEGVEPRRMGSGHTQVTPYQVFETQDGPLFIAAANENLYRRLCSVLGAQELVDDPRFADNSARVRHREALLGALEPRIAAWPREALKVRLEAVGVPAAAVHSLPEVLQDPHIAAAELLLGGEDPHYGRYRIPAPPFAFSTLPLPSLGVAPVLGADAGAILDDLGYDASAQDGLRACGAIP